jgi:hypothetical protein
MVSRLVPVRYQTLLEYRKMPDFPPDHSLTGKARYDVDVIRKWIHNKKSAHNFGGRNGSNGNGHLNERERALVDKKHIEIERERFKLDVERGKYELKTNVYERQLQNVSSTFRELDKAFKHELPPRLEGESAGAIARICGHKLDELRERLAHSFENNGSTIS